MKEIKRQGILFAVQFICAAVFLTASIASVGMRAGGAVMAALPTGTDSSVQADEPPATEDAEETVPAEPAEPSDGSPIVQVDLSLSDGSGNILYKNETDYTFDTGIMLSAGYPIEPVGDGPSVLIIHSHATECYTKEGADTVTGTRSTDPGENMLAVGRVLAEGLREHGVNVLHCTEMHDADSYSQAYINSKASVQRYLEEYPTIKYVIDLHRDAISTSEGGMAKPVVSIDGVDYA
ncbi:MAG: stage II sporulation protein P, partial [Clostridia bacterium]|nr:stage II sporulation protein P [Clostridia bacterium]